MTVSATVDLAEASRRTWDVIVVGAGPAGSMAAHELARRGQTVLLIDRAAFPRGKVCGCCVNGHALAVLREASLEPVIAATAAVALHGIRLAAAGCVAQVPLSGGVSLSRQTFDAALVRAAIDAGAAFLPRTNAALSVGPDGLTEVRRLELRQDDRHERTAARVVVVADGLGGKLATRGGVNEVSVRPAARIGAGVIVTTAPAFYAPGLIYMACGRQGYLGLVRLENGQLNLAAAFDSHWLRRQGGPGAAAVRLLAEVGWPEVANLTEQPWRGTPALTRQARRGAAERLFLIGDAAGYVEPFTGEGMAWALTAGKAVAPLVERAVCNWRPDLARQWDVLYRRLLGRRQKVCRVIAALLRSPRLTRLLIHLLALAPSLAVPVTAYLGERKAELEGLSFRAPAI